MNLVQQLMVAIISVVLGATSAEAFKPLSGQEQQILFWVSMGMLVLIFIVAGLESRKKLKPTLRRKQKTRKRKKGKRRARGP